MAEVRMVCGACGNPVKRSDARCPHCSEPLEWGGGQGGKKSRTAPAPAARPSSGGKRFEVWQIISFIAVIALLGVLLYLELSREHGGSATAAVSGALPPIMQQTPPPPDLAPLKAAVAANPGDPAALLKLANGLHDNGMFQPAVDTYRKYLKSRPTDANARVDMGICLYQIAVSDSSQATRYFDLAAAEMETAIRGTPTHQPAAFNLGVVNLQRGRLEESNRWFKRTVELDKNSELGVRAQQMLTQHSFTQ